MLGNSGKMCSKYGKFYDSPVLLTLVRWTGQEPSLNKLNSVFFTDSVSELYGQRLYKNSFFHSRTGQEIFLHGFMTGFGNHPASYPMDNEDSSMGVKQPGREADHSSPPRHLVLKFLWHLKRHINSNNKDHGFNVIHPMKQVIVESYKLHPSSLSDFGDETLTDWQ
jgi:hypothetical protein